MRASDRFGSGGLAEGFERVETEADDLRGEAEFLGGFRMVRGEHVDGRLARGGQVAAGTAEEERGEAGQDGFQDGSWKGLGEGHDAGDLAGDMT